MRKSLVYIIILLAAIPSLLFAQAEHGKTANVKIKITEEDTRQITPAMVCITSIEDGKVRLPPFAEISYTSSETKSFYSGIEFKKDKNWVGPVRKMNGAGNNEDRSYVYGLYPSLPYWSDPVIYQTSGDFSISLSPGKWRISIEHGNEYVPISETFEVSPDARELTKNFSLRRWINLPAEGWYSGDVHVHHPTTKQQFKDFLFEYAKAEDVHLVNVLEMGNHLGTDFKQEGFGEKFRMCKSNICLVSGQEDPRSQYGHIIGLNIKQMARDTSTYDYYDLVFKQLHLQKGAIVGYAHFAWNGCDLPRGFPWYITTQQIDFVELLQFAKLNTLDYYDYLNLGFRITAAAGSDIPWGSTLGEVRTYVYAGKSFSADNWFSGLKAGHTFVSNGPSLLLNVDGKLPGSEIIKSKGSTIAITVKANSHPRIGKITRVAIYNNDGLLTEKMNIDSLDALTISINHLLQKSQWIAAVVYCNNGAVAHTTPVYVVVDGKPTWDVKKGPVIISTQLNGIRKIEQEEKEKPNPDMGILDRLQKARDFYNSLLSQMNRQ
jgi:hypothetical protein